MPFCTQAVAELCAKSEAISFSAHIPKYTSSRALCMSQLSTFRVLLNWTDSTRHLETFLPSTTLFLVIQCLGADPRWACKTSAENWESAHIRALPWVTGMWCLMLQPAAPARSPWPLTVSCRCVSTWTAAAINRLYCVSAISLQLCQDTWEHSRKKKTGNLSPGRAA